MALSRHMHSIKGSGQCHRPSSVSWLVPLLSLECLGDYGSGVWGDTQAGVRLDFPASLPQNSQARGPCVRTLLALLLTGGDPVLSSGRPCGCL